MRVMHVEAHHVTVHDRMHLKSHVSATTTVHEAVTATADVLLVTLQP